MNIPLNIDWQQILLHMLNFTILALGLFLVLYNPVKKFMQKRKEYYEEIEKKAAEAEENARNIENEYKQLLENAEKEISIRAAEESKRIAAEAEDRIKRAEEQAAKIIADARVWAQHERTRMLEEVQGEIADMVVSSTEQLLSKDKTPETNKAIFDQFLSISGEDNNKKMKVLRNGQDSALLYCVTPPDEKQRAGIYNFLKKKYGYIANLEIIHNESLINGFVLVVGNEVYDWSARGRIGQLKESLNTTASGSSKDDIISLLREKVESFELSSAGREIGTVVSTGDGIAEIAGLKEATYGEIILFDSGVKGMIQELNRDSVGCILFENDGIVMEGSQVICTGKVAGVPVGSAFLGRVVNALGAPIDGLGDITSDDYRMIESPAPGIVDRKPISEPLDTGLLVIDSMFPIGRGQRELIIGDRQTGKTSIALDTIINQKGKDVICVYVAVGQKASSVAHTVEMLRRYDALKYTIVVNASASESASMQYLAPYAGCAFAEYFMYRGADVLIVYDDLSKHAVAYRAISLLLGRSPGREAYPGDVFYLHSRLLERSARLSDELGGGSMTALPIVETQAGDVSAYIPTNIISITDGQIFLESDLFFSGQRPAVNIGLSVSRVGGAAQTQAMKSAAGAVRLDLAQYREMEVFTQFAGDLDDAAREQLNYGQGLMYLLRQPQYSAMTLYEQVITLICGVNRVMIKIPPSKIKSFQKELLDHFMNAHPDICGEIETGNAISEEKRSRIIEIAKEFLESVSEHYIS